MIKIAFYIMLSLITYLGLWALSLTNKLETSTIIVVSLVFGYGLYHFVAFYLKIENNIKK